jgi:UDP-2,3-diacylglucosamine hydrolase
LPDADLPDGAGLNRLRLPATVQVIEFISDLHLCPDLPHTVAAFELYLAQCQADALFILGDLFEAWVGDDSLGQPFEAGIAAALQRVVQRLPVYVMHGNRDFLLGPAFFAHTGCTGLADPCAVSAFDQTVLLSHGDALCLDDVDYQRFRAQVRSPEWQADLLARPLAERLTMAAQMRAASRAHQQQHQPVTWADADPALAGAWLSGAGASTLVHGHTHRPATEQRPEGWQRIVLSDWDLDTTSAPRTEVLRWTAAGFSRHRPTTA